MRLAVIADIHGNLPALRAVLDDIARHGVEDFVVAGDVVNGAPDSVACWELVRSLGAPLLRGNHERYLYDLGTPAARPEWASERFAPTRWAAEQFARAQLDEMRGLPLSWESRDFPELQVVHASPTVDDLRVGSDPDESEFERLFEGSTASVLIRGHVHVPGIRRWRDRTLVTTGSVGLPLDGMPSAKYLLVERMGRELRFDLREVAYDVEETVRRFHDSGMLSEAGPLAKMFLEEVVSGCHQVTPFLRLHERWETEEGMSLAQSVERYLGSTSAISMMQATWN